MTTQVASHTFASLESEWEALLPDCAVDTVFLTPRWQRVWWETLGQGEMVLLAIREEDRLHGIAPMMRHNGTLTFLGDTDLFDYQDFLVPRGNEEIFYPRLLDHLQDEEWDVLDLPSIREDSPTLQALPEQARSRGWLCRVEQQDVVPGLKLPADWDAYLAGLSKKDRHELRRKFRRLSTAAGLRHYACGDPAGLPACVDDLFDLMRLGREEKRDFLSPERQAFFRAMTAEMADAGVLRLYFLEVEGQRVAASLCFDYKGKRLLYNSGFNPAYAHLSVGLLLKATCLREAIEGGAHYYDFLRGDERYKYHMGGQVRSVYRIKVTR